MKDLLHGIFFLITIYCCCLPSCAKSNSEKKELYKGSADNLETQFTLRHKNVDEDVYPDIVNFSVCSIVIDSHGMIWANTARGRIGRMSLRGMQDPNNSEKILERVSGSVFFLVPGNTESLIGVDLMGEVGQFKKENSNDIENPLLERNATRVIDQEYRAKSKNLVIGMFDGNVLFFKLKNGNIEKWMNFKKEELYHKLRNISFSDNKKVLACGMIDGRIQILDPFTKEIKWEYASKDLITTISDLQLSPDGNRLAVSFNDRISVWDWSSKKQV